MAMRPAVLGIDEAGRGPWAGPLAVGAVVLGGAHIEGLTDSKKLTKRRRQALAPQIYEHARAAAVGWASAHEIDQIGLAQALRIATRRAVEQITVPYSEIIIDGSVNFLAGTGKGRYVQTLPKADSLVPSVSAASIIAKVARDAYMADCAQRYPQYGFASNAGYGVAAHRAAIAAHGVCAEHRLSIAPLAPYRPKGFVMPGQAVGAPADAPPVDATADPLHNTTPNTAPTTRAIGDMAEQLVAAELTQRGHQVIAHNWRTRWCEIDVVSVYQGVVYFTEVKYRKTSQYGDGLAAITPTKQRQMRFAAESFLALQPGFAGYQAKLLGAGVSGMPPALDAVVEVD